jgi:hypothetical protein
MVAQTLVTILLTVLLTALVCYAISGPRRLSRTLDGATLIDWERADPWARARFAAVSRRGNITYLFIASLIGLLAMLPWWVITGM